MNGYKLRESPTEANEPAVAFHIAMMVSRNDGNFSLYLHESGGRRRFRMEISNVDGNVLYWFFMGRLHRHGIYECVVRITQLLGERLKDVVIDGVDLDQGMLRAHVTVSHGFEDRCVPITANDGVILSAVANIPFLISGQILASYEHIFVAI